MDELSGLLFSPESPVKNIPHYGVDPAEIPISEYKNIRPHQIDNFYEKIIPKITEHNAKLVKIIPTIQYEGTENKRDTYDLDCICEAGHFYSCKPETLLTGIWCKKCSDIRISQNPKRNKVLSDKLRAFYSTEEGKQKKKESFKIRDITLAKKRNEIRSTITEKECKKCKQVLLVSEFNKKSDALDGYQPYCKTCKKNLKN